MNALKPINYSRRCLYLDIRSAKATLSALSQCMVSNRAVSMFSQLLSLR